MSPRVALVATVRDEAALLRAQLEYHRLLGVERCYVYLDEEGDGTLRTIADLEQVEARRTVDPAPFAGARGLEPFVELWETHVGARQCLNVVDAMSRAEGAGLDWLVAIDADELVCLDRRRTRPGALASALERVPDSAAVAVMPCLEVVPRPSVPGLVFRESRVFKRRRGAPSPVRDPRDGHLVCETRFFGHTAGKSIVRLGRGAAIPRGNHRFIDPDGGPLPSCRLGELLHYHGYDFRDWLRRWRLHQGHPQLHMRGQPYAAHKLLWIELVGQLGEDELEAYFAETVAMREAEMRARLRWSWRRPFRAPDLVEVASVAEAFASEPALRLAVQSAAGLGWPR